VRQEDEVPERAGGFKLEDGRDELLGRARVEVPERLLALTDTGGADRTRFKRVAVQPPLAAAAMTGAYRMERRGAPRCY
jgi:hypothetical protein